MTGQNSECANEKKPHAERASIRDAEELLDALSSDANRLSELATYPRWYVWFQALLAPAFVAVLFLEPVPQSILFIAIVFPTSMLVRFYLRRQHVIPKRWPEGSFGLSVVFGVVVVVAVSAAFIIMGSAVSNGWGAIPVLVVGFATYIFTRREEALIQREIARSSGERT